MKCLWCGEVSFVAPSLAAKKKYCSRECALADPNGGIRNLHKPRVHVISNVDIITKTADCKKCGVGIQVRKRSDQPVWRCVNAERAIQRKSTYGLNEEEFDLLWTTQGGLCAICRGRMGKVCVDHNHKTGKVRGLLCNHCNIGIGALKDDPEVITRAEEYVRTRI